MMPHLTGARPARPRLALALLAITAAVFALLPHVLASAAPTPTAGAKRATADETQSYGIWPDSTVPATPSTGDTSSVTLGLVFSSATDGQLRGVQYYAAGANRVATTGKVWNAKGRKIASISFPATSSDGWKTALFSTPITASQT